MIRKKSEGKREVRTPEQLEKEKERIRKLQQTVLEKEGNPYKAYIEDYDPLLEALIKEHPEKDPANIK
jgi:hypothetical protein